MKLLLGVWAVTIATALAFAGPARAVAARRARCAAAARAAAGTTSVSDAYRAAFGKVVQASAGHGDLDKAAAAGDQLIGAAVPCSRSDQELQELAMEDIDGYAADHTCKDFIADVGATLKDVNLYLTCEAAVLPPWLAISPRLAQLQADAVLSRCEAGYTPVPPRYARQLSTFAGAMNTTVKTLKMVERAKALKDITHAVLGGGIKSFGYAGKAYTFQNGEGKVLTFTADRSGKLFKVGFVDARKLEDALITRLRAPGAPSPLFSEPFEGSFVNGVARLGRGASASASSRVLVGQTRQPNGALGYAPAWATRAAGALAADRQAQLAGLRRLLGGAKPRAKPRSLHVHAGGGLGRSAAKAINTVLDREHSQATGLLQLAARTRKRHRSAKNAALAARLADGFRAAARLRAKAVSALTPKAGERIVAVVADPLIFPNTLPAILADRAVRRDGATAAKALDALAARLRR